MISIGFFSQLYDDVISFFKLILTCAENSTILCHAWRVDVKRLIYSVINNEIVRLPASAHLPAMAVASVVRRPGGCCPFRRSSRAGASSETASQ